MLNCCCPRMPKWSHLASSVWRVKKKVWLVDGTWSILLGNQSAKLRKSLLRWNFCCLLLQLTHIGLLAEGVCHMIVQSAKTWETSKWRYHKIPFILFNWGNKKHKQNEKGFEKEVMRTLLYLVFWCSFLFLLLKLAMATVGLDIHRHTTVSENKPEMSTKDGENKDWTSPRLEPQIYHLPEVIVCLWSSYT